MNIDMHESKRQGECMNPKQPSGPWFITECTPLSDHLRRPFHAIFFILLLLLFYLFIFKLAG